MDFWSWLILITKVLAVFLLFALAPLVLVLAERQILGRLQSRYGPVSYTHLTLPTSDLV